MSRPGTADAELAHPERLSARRTRTLVRAAFEESVARDGFDDLTVRGLAGRAMISRATFYRYYRDKHGVAEELFGDAVARLAAVGDDDERRRREWIAFFEHIAARHRLYRALLVESRTGWFARHMRETFTSLTAPHSTSGGMFGTDTSQALSRILAAIFTETITWWLAADLPIAPEAAATATARAARAVIREALGETHVVPSTRP